MKTPAFWYRPESYLARALSPLEWMYRCGGAVRRFSAKPYRARVPLICVGNVTAGGSGKTPTALALAALLQGQGHRPVFVTRGYGGAERGPLRVDAACHSAADVGDEALLLNARAPVWIGRDRVAAIREAEKEATHIILDDGLQNPHIAPDVSLLVIDGAVGIGNGHIIPAGPLREPLAEALKRVNAVLTVGNDNQLSSFPRKRESIVARLRDKKSHARAIARRWIPAFAGMTIMDGYGDEAGNIPKPILHARLHPAIPPDFPRAEKFFAFAGIGRPEKFYDLCRKEGLTLAATEDFADHHVFTDGELRILKQRARNFGARLLTTEKDFMRLPPDFRAKVLTFPIRLVFDDVAAVEKLIYSTTAPSLPS